MDDSRVAADRLDDHCRDLVALRREQVLERARVIPGELERVRECPGNHAGRPWDGAVHICAVVGDGRLAEHSLAPPVVVPVKGDHHGPARDEPGQP